MPLLSVFPAVAVGVLLVVIYMSASTTEPDTTCAHPEVTCQ